MGKRVRIDKKNKQGRPTKYTPERVKNVLSVLEVGLGFRTAAAFAGITPQTINNWQKKYPEFDRRVKQAQARFVVEMAGNLANLARNGNVGANIFILKARTEEFQERGVVEIGNYEPNEEFL